MSATQKKDAAVIGYPVDHSLSPLIHNRWIAQYGIEATYRAINVLPQNLQQWVESLAQTGFAGFNVTLPHKVAIMALCDTLDDRARRIGAVNTVTLDGSGRLHGTNTDAFGFMQNLREQAPLWSPQDGPALVLGAGGAARAAIYALLESGVDQMMICNRDPDRAASLAQDARHITGRAVSIQTLDWGNRSKGVFAAALLVNTTSLGMSGQPPLEIDLGEASCAVYDIVYRPLMTPLLHSAQERGLPIITGLGMLLHQARPAFESWFGVLPEIDAALRAQIEGSAT
jgi:shikimate dehydrogenase